MIYKSKISDLLTLETPCLVVGVYSSKQQDHSFKKLDVASNGALRKILKTEDLSCEPGTSQLIYDLDGITAKRVLLVGLGKKKDLDPINFSKSIENLINTMQKTSCNKLSICLILI